MLTASEMKYLVALGESASIGEAADRCGVTQSALSQSLASMEGKLGAQLFVRRRGMLRPTVEGEAIAQRVRAMLMQYSQLESDLASVRESHAGRTNIGIGPAISSLLLNPALTEFYLQHPASTVTFKTGTWSAMEKLLSSGEISLFLGGFSSAFSSKEFTSIPFSKERVAFLASKNHPLFAQPSVTVSQLIRYPVIAHSADSWNFWRSLVREEDMSLFKRNMPASIMENPLDASAWIGRSQYVISTIQSIWQASLASAEPLLKELTVANTRNVAHMYFVYNAGHQFTEDEQALMEIFQRLRREIG